MYHFAALLWDCNDRNAAAAAARFADRLKHSRRPLREIVNAEGMMVFIGENREPALRPHMLGRNNGVILGKVFRTSNTGKHRPVVFDDAEAERIAESHGERLISDYWGSYIALIRSRDGGSNYVIRDCSGWLPCYRTRSANVEIFFSDLHDLAELGIALSLNYRYLAASIYQPMMHIRECGIAEVTEVLAGECVAMERGAVRQFVLWEPRLITLRRSIEDYGQAEEELRATTQSCIDAWGGSYERVLLSLSGGLDSAIVLGTLAKSSQRPTVTCFNQFTPGTADDERRYARLAAKLAGVKLIEMEWADPRLDARVFDIPKAPKPHPGDIYWWLERDARNELTASANAQATWTGQVGDHAFWAFTNFPILADWMELHGALGSGMFQVIDDAARLARKSYWSVFRTALQVRKSASLWTFPEQRSQHGHFVNAEALPERFAEYVANPWAATIAKIPKARQAQIVLLAEALNRHRHMPGGECAYQRHPLMAQPLLELCLQIPPHTLLKGGRRRALARTAFLDRVPREIIERDDKGETSARMRAMIRRNEPFLRDVTLDGILVREGIVKRRGLESILVDGQPYRQENLWPLVACVVTEIWAQSQLRGALRFAA